MDELTSWVARSGYLPHGVCYAWSPALLWAMEIADAIAFVASPRAAGINAADIHDALERAAGHVHDGRVGVAIIGPCDQGDRQGPALSPCPAGFVAGELLPKAPAFRSREERPGGQQVAGRIADAEAAEVDHRDERAVSQQQVAGVE
eukprot:gene19102-27062_t